MGDETRDGREDNEEKPCRSRLSELDMQKSHKDGDKHQTPADPYEHTEKTYDHPDKKEYDGRDLFLMMILPGLHKEPGKREKNEKEEDALKQPVGDEGSDIAAEKSSGESSRSDDGDELHIECAAFVVEIAAVDGAKDHLHDRDTYSRFYIVSKKQKGRNQHRSSADTKKAAKRSYTRSDNGEL